MREFPLAALDLPLRVLVREREDGRVLVAFHPVAPMPARTGVVEAQALRLQPAQRRHSGAALTAIETRRAAV